MDERLKGRTILIGREPKQNQLAISVSGIGKVGMVGAVGSVPGCVSRWKDGTAHCQISIGQNGDITLKNLKEANVTYVNGAAIISKRIDGNSNVELGKDHFTINVNLILQAASKLLPQVQQIVQAPAAVKPATPPPPAKEYSIRHLKQVWENYDRALMNLQIEQQTKNNQARLQGILSQLGMLCVIIPSVIPQIPIPGVLRVILVAGAIGMSLYLFFRGKKPDELYVVKKKKLDEKFEKEYICPNKDCGHFLDGRKYSLLVQDGKCKYCKAKFKV